MPQRCALVLFVVVLAAVVPCRAEPVSQPRITIIIDDLGYALRAGRRAVELPGPIAFAVLPHTPRAAALAAYADARGKDVLLHQPLQSVDLSLAQEPGGITLDMSRQQFADVIESNLSAVPQAIGVNGHRGSLLTRHPGHMAWLMEELASRGLFFVDSYTTEHSVALAVAREQRIPAARRDVFLDADPTPAGVAREFARLKRLARTQGHALGIGHPYPVTLDFLETALPLLADEGYELKSVRDYLRAPAANPATPPRGAVASGE